MKVSIYTDVGQLYTLSDMLIMMWMWGHHTFIETHVVYTGMWGHLALHNL
jgi:hypothetical protein